MTKLKYDINDRDQPFNLPLKKKKIKKPCTRKKSKTKTKIKEKFVNKN